MVKRSILSEFIFQKAHVQGSCGVRVEMSACGYLTTKYMGDHGESLLPGFPIGRTLKGPHACQFLSLVNHGQV